MVLAMNNVKLPVGIDQFDKLIKSGFYYVDKTRLIEQLLQNWGEVNLFTRPRRFGKTLNMSMLKSFFEIGADKTLFDQLYIAANKELCEEHMGQYPVIFLSLKGVDGLNFEEAKSMLKITIRTEAQRHYELKKSEKVSEENRKLFNDILSGQDERIEDSLRMLSQIMFEHYGKKSIILIDEYDVPLDKAFQHGYYKGMVSLLRGLFGQALKTNEFLQFAVLTGCLRVSKESIFTGLNNFKVLSIADVRFDEQFGFTDEEVRKLLKDYDLEDYFSEAKEWYDGYHFGNADIYCPWDVINYVEHLRYDPEAEPEAFWINSSGNDLVKRFVAKADQTTKDEIEQLIAGDVIEKKIRQDLTYDEIDQSIDNLWSVLFTTGYLTQTGRAERGIYKLMIPNKEVREVFIDQIQQWFDQTVVNDEDRMSSFYQSFAQGKAKDVQDQLTSILAETISILDTKARNEEKENFYHGMMLGLLRNHRNWIVKLNVESGEGFVDILIKPEDPDEGILIELKYSKTFDGLEKACERAMEQIKDRRYDEALRDEGRCHILAYGIAFCKKRCKVVVQKI
mgnify:FL=1